MTFFGDTTFSPTNPDISDVGNRWNISDAMRSNWSTEMALRAKYRKYFTGEIFKEKVSSSDNDEENPEKYPVGINLVKMLCEAQADALWGEWEEDIVALEPAQDVEVCQPEKEASRIAAEILRRSNANSMLWEVGLDAQVCGAGVWKVVKPAPGKYYWNRVPIDNFFPIFDPDNPDEILEAYVIVSLTRDQVKARYGFDPQKDTCKRIERWTAEVYENFVDDKRIDIFSGRNPWGVVPYVVAPRLRTHHPLGDALTEDLIRPQDELNMRIADQGEAINYNAHPIFWGRNLPKGFNTRNFEVGPGFMWDLGKTGFEGADPEVGILEAKNSGAPVAENYVKFLYDWSKTSSFAPPVALGEDSNAGSGITLEISMWPLIKSVRRSRAYMGAAIVKGMQITARMMRADGAIEPSRGIKVLEDGGLMVKFASVMPRDKAADVDMVQKLMATNPPSISLETAVKILGFGTSEVDRIKEMVNDKDLYAREEAQMQAQKEINQQKMDQAQSMFEQKQAAVKELDSAAGNAPKKDVNAQ